MKTMKIQICPKKTSKQRFLSKIFACGGQNNQKNAPAASKIVNIFCVQNMKFIIKIWRCQSSIWTKNSLNCVQKNIKIMNFREKNNHENHELGKITMKTMKSCSTMAGNPDEHESGGVLT